MKRFGRQSVTGLIRDYQTAGHTVRGAGIVVGSLIDPASIGNDHIRIHALEGQLFRRVVEDAAGRSGVPGSIWRERDLYEVAVGVFKRPERALRNALAALGQGVEGSWRAERKAAALAAWLVLAGRPATAHARKRKPGAAARVVLALAVGAIASLPACALLEKVDKVSKIPGLEEAQVTEGLKGPHEPLGQGGPASPLQASPSDLDFGQKHVASESHETVVISSPFDFPVTLVRVTVQGCGFALAGQIVDRPVIAPHGQLVLTVSFHPAAKQACSGLLLLEIDSAGGRFTRVPLKGRGI